MAAADVVDDDVDVDVDLLLLPLLFGQTSSNVDPSEAQILLTNKRTKNSSIFRNIF